MADAILSVELQAKVDAFVKGLLDAANSADNTEKKVNELSKSVSQNVANINKVNFSAFQNALKQNQLSIVKFGESVEKIPKILPKIITGSNQAAFALTNLGRVAQDAPFGFIGIQNNLNPLLESFQRLRAEAGSNKAALSALASSLVGPAGLGLALSLVGSAILLYQQYQQKATKADEAKEKAQKKLVDTNDAYFKSLSAVERATLKGEQDAQKEIVSLQQIYFAARNVKLSTDERYKAAKALQEQYPQTFKNFSQEEIALGKASNAYKGLADDILSVARAAAGTDIITENTKKLTLEQLKYNKTQKELDKINEQIANRPKQQPNINLGTGFSTAGDLAVQQLAALTSKQAELQKELNASQKIKTSLVKENLDVQKLVNREVEKEGVVALIGIDKTKDKVEKVKKQLKRDNTNTLGSLPELLGLGDLSKPFLIEPKLVIKPIATGLNELLEIAATAEKAIDRITSLPNAVNLAAVTLGTSFEAMGAAIAQGGDVVSAAGEVLQSAFADILSQLGQQFITMGAAKIAAGILATPFGGKLIADGAGLVALGAGLSLGGGLVKSAGKGKAASPVTAFANGGVISGPTLGLMGEYAGAKSDPEVVAPLSKLKKMLGQQDSAGNPITPANQQPVYVQQRLEIQGTKLVALIDTVESQNKRRG